MTGIRSICAHTSCSLACRELEVKLSVGLSRQVLAPRGSKRRPSHLSGASQPCESDAKLDG